MRQRILRAFEEADIDVPRPQRVVLAMPPVSRSAERDAGRARGGRETEGEGRPG
jgi:hypothetical protein